MSIIFNFFATSEEIFELWDCIAEFPGMRLLEADSVPGEETREFDRFPRAEWQAPDRNFSVVAWASRARGQPRSRQITFSAAAMRGLGASGRSTLTSPAFISMSCVSSPADDLIGPCELRYWTEKMAARWWQFDTEQVEEVDWEALSQEVKAIKREIATRSVAKWRGAPVSQKVANALSAGESRLWLWGATGTI